MNVLTFPDQRVARVLDRLQRRSIVLVGMMGAGKTSIGRRLAAALGLPFVDADSEIEKAAGLTISEIFARYGEAFFRDREHHVITRLLNDGQRVVATGGGAFMNAPTRARVAVSGVSLWLHADAEVLLRRVRKRSNRPLLDTQDPEATLRALIEERNAIYAQADFHVVSRDGPQEIMVDTVLATLDTGLPTIERLAPALRPAVSAPSTFIPAVPVAGIGDGAQARVTVPLNLHARRYDIVIGSGLIEEAGVRIDRLAPGSACAIVTDSHVAPLYRARLEQTLAAAGIRHATIQVAPGEGSKDWATFQGVCDAIIAGRFERGDLVVALGGGVVGDLAGFAAASVRRGMRVVQIPTSLLAQVDSSVGGKTAINSPHGKNLVGAFHQPSLVLADIGVLASLPAREFRAGYAEMVKYGLLGDATFFTWLDRHRPEVFAGEPALAQAIATSCRAKAAIVARDETEQGDRALLNLGHTFGHALESLVHFDGERLVHGEGVAIGMACAFRFSASLGHCSPGDAEQAEAHLRAAGLPTRIADVPGWNADAEAVLHAMYQDKKVQRGALTFILVRGIGQAFVARNVPAEAVSAFLTEELRH